MSDTKAVCVICGEPMPDGETMFKFHGYSGTCPKPPLPKEPTEIEKLRSELAAANQRADALQTMYDAAVTIQGDAEVMKYITSGNAIPVSRCTVSADLLRQLVEGRSTANKRADEAEADAKRFRWLKSAKYEQIPYIFWWKKSETPFYQMIDEAMKRE